MHSKFSSIISSIKECLTFLTTHELNILTKNALEILQLKFWWWWWGGGVQFNTLFTIFKSFVLRTQMLLCSLKR